MNTNENLIKIRETLGLSQLKTARLLGMGQGNYSTMEAGKRGLSKKAIFAYMERLKVSESYLLRGQQPMFLTEYPLYSSRMRHVMNDLGIVGDNLRKTINPRYVRDFEAILANDIVPDIEMLKNIFSGYIEKVNFEYILTGFGEPLISPGRVINEKNFEFKNQPDHIISSMRDVIDMYRDLLSEKDKVIEILKEQVDKKKNCPE
jgi:hypothetical protein